MKHLTRCLAVLLTALLAAGCGSRPSASLEAFTTAVYRPAYASGFEILGAEGLQSTILRTRTPGREPKGPARRSASSATANPCPRVSTARCSAARRSASSACPRPMWRCSMPRASCSGSWASRGSRGIERLDRGPQRRDRRGGLRRQCRLRTAACAAPRPGAALRRAGGKRHGAQAPRAAYPLRLHRRIPRESPLGKAEWIVAAGELVGRRAEAEARFDSIPQRYDALRTRVAGAAAEAPKVMINSPYGDSWFMASQGSYVARLIADAGGDYIYKKNTSNRSLPIDVEEAYLLASAADVDQCRGFRLSRRDEDAPAALCRCGMPAPRRGLQLRPPDESERRERLLGVGRRASRSGAARPGEDLPSGARPGEFVYYRRLE